MSYILPALVQMRLDQAPEPTLEVLTGFVLNIRAYSFQTYFLWRLVAVCSDKGDLP